MIFFIKTLGRLGNCLFQYAHGRSLALKHNAELMMALGSNEPPYFEHFNAVLTALPQRSRLIDYILIGIRTRIPSTNDAVNRMLTLYPFFLSCKMMKICHVPHGIDVEDTVRHIKGNTYFEGGGLLGYNPIIYEHEETIKKELTFKEISLSKKTLSVASSIHRAPQSIGIHVRRGDFLDISLAVSSVDYYKNAYKMLTNKISQPIQVFVFSDDIPWTREHLPKVIENDLLYFVDHNNEETCVEDLYLLSQCKHQILSRGTFSWWGAFLNPYSHKLIVMPSDQYHEYYHAKHGKHLLYADAL